MTLNDLLLKMSTGSRKITFKHPTFDRPINAEITEIIINHEWKAISVNILDSLSSTEDVWNSEPIPFGYDPDDTQMVKKSVTTKYRTDRINLSQIIEVLDNNI